MKILLWTSYYFPLIGGVEMMTRSLAKELHKMGHSVIVFADHKNSSQFHTNTIDKIPIYYFPFQASLESKKPSLLKATLTQAMQIFDGFAPDVVNIHGWYEFFAFFQIRIIKKVPIFLTIHGLLGQLHHKANSCIRLWSIAKGINTVSHTLIDQLLKTNWHHPSLRVIYNGIALSEFPEPVAETGTNRIGMIGRFSPEKRFDIGLYAFRKIKEKLPDATLCLAGGGDDWEMLYDLRKKLELEDAVQMPGLIQPNQIYSIIDHANIIWIPSLYESFCLVALEAAVRKRAVIANNVFGLKEVIEDGITGLLVAAENPDVLAKTTLELLAKPIIRTQMGNNAHKRAEALFSIQTCAAQYLQMYQTI